MANTTTRIVRTYRDAKAIGEIEMTDAQFARYVRDADDGKSGTGTMLFSELMAYGLEYVASEVVDLDTTIYVAE